MQATPLVGSRLKSLESVCRRRSCGSGTQSTEGENESYFHVSEKQAGLPRQLNVHEFIYRISESCAIASIYNPESA